MRTSRLITLLLLVRSHGWVSLPVLAAALDVSARTVMRDLASLRAAGVPLVLERGAGGTTVTLAPGVHPAVAASPGEPATTGAAAGPVHAAAAIGLGLLLHQAGSTLIDTLPAAARAHADRARERFLLDGASWDDATAHAPFLPELSQAVWDSQTVSVRCQRSGRELTLRFEPLGMVLSHAHWHVVGRDVTSNELRPLRLARVLAVALLNDYFPRPAGFALAAHWRAARGALAPELFRAEARVRLSPRGLVAAARLLDPLPAQSVRSTAGPADAQGWREAMFPITSLDDAVAHCLRFGPELEVLAPPALRQAMAQAATRLLALYAPANTGVASRERVQPDGSSGRRSAR